MEWYFEKMEGLKDREMDGLIDFANDYDIKATAILLMSRYDMIDDYSE